MFIFNKFKEAPLSRIRKMLQKLEYLLRLQRIVCIGVRSGFNATFREFRTSVLLFRSITSLIVMNIIYVTNLKECSQQKERHWKKRKQRVFSFHPHHIVFLNNSPVNHKSWLWNEQLLWTLSYMDQALYFVVNYLVSWEFALTITTEIASFYFLQVQNSTEINRSYLIDLIQILPL